MIHYFSVSLFRSSTGSTNHKHKEKLFGDGSISVMTFIDIEQSWQCNTWKHYGQERPLYFINSLNTHSAQHAPLLFKTSAFI